MHRARNTFLFLTILGLFSRANTGAAEQAPADCQPDPKSVQRYGPAYRYPQAGWIVLHIEGEPYERGYQHGQLMAPEIAAYIRCFAANQSPSAPSEGWRNTRKLANALFLRRYEKEYLEEMKGIADGATAAGARFDNRPIDLVDIAAVNVWPEVDTLDSGLEALPTGLEGIRFPHRQPRAMPPPQPMHCSAFAATGSATRDGKAILGHITMFGLYPSNFFNVWIDVKPAKGHRVFIQGFPGGIQSGLDYYMNDAGLVITETTLAQTRFDITGMTLASRIRQAMQYADSIDKAVETLKAANNGLYTNEWLIADMKTNEIAMFELGTHKTRLYRSGQNDWFGGTEGFYWGCNNTKDLDVRLETIPGVQGRPANVVFCPTDRDKTWQRLYREHKGKIDADFGKLAFTTPPLAAYHSLDAKFTTADMAKELKTWALFGPPLGRTWQPREEERRRFPEIRPLVSNPWTILHATLPAKERNGVPVAVDIPEPLNSPVRSARLQEENSPLPTVPAWHGTIFPKKDADIWLATAFANYERIVARENVLRERNEANRKGDESLTSKDQEELALNLFAYRSAYLASARARGDLLLANTRSAVEQSDWYHIAAGKGVLLLHELRQMLGRKIFEEMMDTFGRDHAGKKVSTLDFREHVERTTGKNLKWFFRTWLHLKGLPKFQLDNVTVERHSAGSYEVRGEIHLEGAALYPTAIQLFVETAEGEKSQTVTVDVTSERVSFAISAAAAPQRIVVDKYGSSAKANGGIFSVLSFYEELDQTLIVYGMADEKPTNHEAAEALQQAIRERHANFTVPIKTDRDVTEDDLKSHHVLLIGRPDSNLLVQRFQAALPITFGSRSFTVCKENYAHPGSAVVVAAENPLNARYSLVVLAGLSAESTLRAVPQFMWQSRSAPEVLVLPNKGSSRALLVPAKELVKELEQPNGDAGKKVARPAGIR